MRICIHKSTVYFNVNIISHLLNFAYGSSVPVTPKTACYFTLTLNNNVLV